MTKPSKKPVVMDLEDALRADADCPACNRPCPKESRISGVCPRCKDYLATAHAKILKPGFKESPVHIERDQKEHSHFGESSERILTTEDAESGEGALERLCHKHGWNKAYAMQVITDTAEFRGENDTGGKMDIAAVLRLFKSGLRIVKGDGRDVRAVYDRLHYFMLAMNWPEELGGIDNCTDLGAALKVTKANANKYVNLFRDVLPAGLGKLPTQPGQRDDAAREKFTAVRNSKLRKK